MYGTPELSGLHRSFNGGNTMKLFETQPTLNQAQSHSVTTSFLKNWVALQPKTDVDLALENNNESTFEFNQVSPSYNV